ncbi:MAG TPA: LEA type 2 family protein [Steroidobacteraceae bacterium]|nr:LEA type 2 family protein [Steroidobacteraceae bacterium]
MLNTLPPSRWRTPSIVAWSMLVLLSGGWLGGCSALAPKLETPQLSLLGIQMLSTDMFAQKFRVRVKVENPNDLELPVRGLDYKIILMGDSFADGQSSDRFVVPAKGEAEFDMVVTTNFVSSLGRLISRVGGGKLENLDYEIAGEVLLDKGFVKKIPFNHHGQVDLARATGRKSGEI